MTNSKVNPTLEREILGGWTPFRPLDENCMNVFNEAICNLIGVNYTPIEVSTQVVNGINYRFRCDAKCTSPNAPTYQCTIEVYQAPNCTPVVTNITRHGNYDGWTPFRNLDNECRTIFNEATECLCGAIYEPLEVCTQVSCVGNYRFLCNAECNETNHGSFNCIIEICKEINGDLRICEIKRI